jgi:DNA polymerase elongation subunit (family B)
LQENRELAKVSFTDLEHAFFRANGAKVRNMVIGFIKRFAKDLGVSNTRRVRDAPSKYEGAFVFDVRNHLNRESPTACLDFNSLYPSIIIAYNYSPEKIATEGHGD